MSYPYIPGTGAGRPIEPTHTPAAEPKPPTEGAPSQTGYVGHTKSNDDLPRSDHGRLEPAFDRFSKILAADLDRDSRQREALMNDALGITPEATLRARLGDAVRSNQLTEVEANRYRALKYPHLRPEDVK